MAALPICYARAGALVAVVEAAISGVSVTVGGEADSGIWLEGAKPVTVVRRQWLCGLQAGRAWRRRGKKNKEEKVKHWFI